MPTSTWTIAANADDGWVSTSGIFTNQVNMSISNFGVGEGGNAYLRFANITIPDGATINNATLRMFAIQLSGTGKMRCKLDSRPAPGNPAIASEVWNPTNLISGTTGTKVTVTPTNTTTYAQTDADIKPLVAALVAANSYNNGAMLFYVSQPVVGATASPVYVGLYGRTSGGASQAAKLIIDFTAGGGGREPDRTTYRYG